MKTEPPPDVTHLVTMMASQIMTSPAVTVAAAAPISEAARLLLSGNHSSLPVVDGDHHLIGMVDEAAVFRAQAAMSGIPLGGNEYPNLLEVPRTVSDVMWRDVLWVGPGDSVRVCLSLMMRHHGRSLPVLRRSHLVGIVTRRDALLALNLPVRDRQHVLDLRDGPLPSRDGSNHHAAVGI